MYIIQIKKKYFNLDFLTGQQTMKIFILTMRHTNQGMFRKRVVTKIMFLVSLKEHYSQNVTGGHPLYKGNMISGQRSVSRVFNLRRIVEK